MVASPLPFGLQHSLPDASPPTLVSASFFVATGALNLQFDQPMGAAVAPPLGTLIINDGSTGHQAWSTPSNPLPDVVQLISAGTGLPPIGPNQGRWTQPGGAMLSAAGLEWPTDTLFPVSVT